MRNRVEVQTLFNALLGEVHDVAAGEIRADNVRFNSLGIGTNASGAAGLINKNDEMLIDRK